MPIKIHALKFLVISSVCLYFLWARSLIFSLHMWLSLWLICPSCSPAMVCNKYSLLWLLGMQTSLSRTAQRSSSSDVSRCSCSFFQQDDQFYCMLNRIKSHESPVQNTLIMGGFKKVTFPCTVGTVDEHQSSGCRSFIKIVFSWIQVRFWVSRSMTHLTLFQQTVLHPNRRNNPLQFIYSSYRADSPLNPGKQHIAVLSPDQTACKLRILPM